MGNYSLNFSLIFLILFFFLFVFDISIQQNEDACKNVDCGKGKCVPSLIFPGYECDCFPGWNRTFAIFPSSACAIPNCKLQFQCGNGAPPPPPPTPPPFNLSDPCNLVLCGDGVCVPNGTSHTCNCFDGSVNILNITGFACIKQCFIGDDCGGVGLGPNRPPPPPKSNGTLASPPKSNGTLVPPPQKGSNGVSKSLRNYPVLVMILALTLALV